MKDNIELVRGCGIEWLRKRAPRTLDGIFTDPPWGAGPAFKGQKEWKTLIRQMSLEAWRVLRPGGKLLVWVGINRMDGAIRAISSRFTFSGAIVIRTIPPYPYGRWMLGGDHILVYGRGTFARPVVRMATGEMTITSRYGNFAASGQRTWKDTDHPCPRDHRPAVAISRQWFAPGDRVADPFGGSAVIACVLADMGAIPVSIEVDPKMHRMAVHRVKHRTPNLFPQETIR